MQPLALRLDVGLPTSTSLLSEHDLDNYLFPLVSHLEKQGTATPRSVWATKRHTGNSLIRLATAVPVDVPAGSVSYPIHTTASASTLAFKQQISDQLAGAAVLRPGPVGLEVAFAVGPARNWLNLWKPTIDAMDGLLGRTVATRAWHPQDGRIVELGLHCTSHDDLGYDVLMRVAVRELP